MLYLPTELYEVESPLSPAEVTERVKSNTNLKKPRFPYFDGLDKKFQGRIDGNHFVLTRTTFHQNPSRPVLVGDIHSSGLGSRIKIRFRLYRILLVFWALWMTAVIAALFSARELTALGLLVLGYLLCIIPFNIEVNDAKEALGEILDSSRS